MESQLHNSTDMGSTMVHLAARYGHVDVVELVIEEYHLDPTARDKVSVY